MGAVRPRLLTAEEFWNLPENGTRRELVRGEVVEEMPPGGIHGVIAVTFSALLLAWARSGPGGYVGVESGFVLRRDPDVVRAPDVFYVRASKVPHGGAPEAFWNVAPDLAVEVVSPGEGAEEVRDKVRDYLVAGTLLVLVVYPRAREVVVHTPDGLARAHGAAGKLEGFDVLPGFSCTVAELFD